MEEYLYGIDYLEDLKRLYGDNYKSINDERINLFESFTCNVIQAKELRNILQNPMPITFEEFKLWIDEKNKVINLFSFYLSKYDEYMLEEIESFIFRHHLEKEVMRK